MYLSLVEIDEVHLAYFLVVDNYYQNYVACFRLLKALHSQSTSVTLSQPHHRCTITSLLRTVSTQAVYIPVLYPVVLVFLFLFLSDLI